MSREINKGCDGIKKSEFKDNGMDVSWTELANKWLGASMGARSDWDAGFTGASQKATDC
jgi:hypothetical protein